MNGLKCCVCGKFYIIGVGTYNIFLEKFTCNECVKGKTLHRVQVKYRKQNIACPLNCVKAESGLRCNKYWEKCAIYMNTIWDKF